MRAQFDCNASAILIVIRVLFWLQCECYFASAILAAMQVLFCECYFASAISRVLADIVNNSQDLTNSSSISIGRVSRGWTLTRESHVKNVTP